MVRSLLCAAFLVLAAMLPASAQSILNGTYNGVIFSGDGQVPVETVFSGKGASLAGTYVVSDPRGTYDGTLADAQIDDSGVLTMNWTDKFGVGTVTMAFAADGRSFSGLWYMDGQLGGVWTGTYAP